MKWWQYLTFLTIHNQGTETLHLMKKKKARQKARKKEGRKVSESMTLLCSRSDKYSEGSFELWKKTYWIKEECYFVITKMLKPTLLLQHLSDPGYCGTWHLEVVVCRPWSSGWVFATGHLLSPSSWRGGQPSFRQGSCQVPYFPQKGPNPTTI